MSATLLTDITIFILSLWVGFEVISKVPATLHTPLMSAANSIHGIVLAGAMLIAVTAHDAVGYVIAFVAAAFAAMNVVGGYAVTGRMLKMFKRRPAAPVTPPAAASAAFARNVSSLLLHLVADGVLAIDPSDDIQAGVVITHGGEVIHPATAALLAEDQTRSAGGAAQ